LHPATRKSVALPVVILVLALSACGGGSSSTGGAGDETGTTLAARGDGSPSTESPPTPSADTRGTGNFSLVFEQSFQDCASCGIWFDSAELVIEHDRGTFKSSQVGSLLIKQSPYHQGTFNAKTSAIPRVADIRNATLYLRLNPHEGISNNDFSSTLSVYGNVGGNMVYLREITAQFDIKGNGFSKSNPVVPIDFTEYAKRI
jgi:hypothetical protein